MIFEFLNKILPMNKAKKELKSILQLICPHMLFSSFWSPSLYKDNERLYKMCSICGREKKVINNITPLQWK